jgi:predicted nucleic acid-binding protein
MPAEGLELVDTNVIVYAFDRGQPAYQAAAEALLRRLREQGTLCLSTQVLQETYVTLTRKAKTPLSPDEVIELIDDLSAWPVCGSDAALVRAAALLSRDAVLSLWDALIVTAAARLGAVRLYTEDLNHGQVIAGVEIVNPFRGLR